MTIKSTTNSNKQYLNDTLTKQQIRQWVDNKQKVGIHTTVGSGKSTLISGKVTEVLRETKKNTLFISNRKLIVQQQEDNQEGLNKYCPRVSYSTTQKIITQYKMSGVLPETDVLIIDEYHQLVNDSSFNTLTSLMLEIIDKLDIPMIFISATPPQDFIVLDVVIDDKAINNQAQIYNQAYVYHYKDEILRVLEQIITQTDDKVLFYINNSREIASLQDKYGDISLVHSSSNNAVLQPYIDTAKINKLIEIQQFEERILFTTKVIDSGVNIIDEKLKHIFVFSYDVEEVLQVVGRKRDNKDDLSIYLKNYNPRELGGHKSTITYKLGIIKDFKENPLQTIRRITGTEEEYLIQELFVHNEELRLIINEAVEENLKREYGILENISNNTFVKELEKVNIYATDETYSKEWNKLESYLKTNYNNETVWYNANDKVDIIENINFRENGVMRKSISKLNYFLEKKKSKYRIKKINTTNDGKRYGNAWVLTKI